MKDIFIRLTIVILFIGILGCVIAYARGYRVDLEKIAVQPTGILAISSSPKAAKVYINGILKGVTDLNLSLIPGQYQIEIKKDGYTSWNKTIKLKGELVISVEALLFPINPSLSPLTNLGIIKAIPVDQTDRIIVFTDTGDVTKDGIYLFETNKKPLSFLPPLKLIILKNEIPASSEINFKDVTVDFSPDYKQAIFSFSQSAYLLSLEEENLNPSEVTNYKETLLEAWSKENEKNNLKILETFPKEIAKIASDSFHIVSFSPDEIKLLYTPKKNLDLPLIINPPLIATNQTPETRNLIQNNFYVYDKKEDKNFQFATRQLADKFQNPEKILWYYDSRHLIFIEEKNISITEYDGTNRQTVYSGPFENSFFTITTDGKIIVLTNLNPEANKLSDLYLVGIR